MVQIDEFVDLLQEYISGKLSIEDFFSHYSALRSLLLDEYDTHPVREKEIAIQKEFLAGNLSEKEFVKETEDIQKEVQAYFRRRGNIVPFSREYELLTDDIVFLIERLDGGEDVYGEDVLNEVRFYDAIKRILDELVIS